MMALEAIESLGPSDDRRRQRTERHQIFTLTYNGLIYLCITDRQFPQDDAFNYLNAVIKAFAGAGLESTARNCSPYALRNEFKVLVERMTDEACGDITSNVKIHMKDIHNQMKENLNKVSQRGESLIDLEERSELLKNSSIEFQRTATKLKRKMILKSAKLWIVLIVILLIIVAIIVILIVLLATKKI
jgi:hypothetical protein